MGAIEKREPYRNRRILEFPKKYRLPCFRCNKPFELGGTEACHIQGPRAQWFGKGKGIKPDDDCVAFLCRDCHEFMDRYRNGKDRWERSEEFLYLVMASMNFVHRMSKKIGFKF